MTERKLVSLQIQWAQVLPSEPARLSSASLDHEPASALPSSSSQSSLPSLAWQGLFFPSQRKSEAGRSPTDSHQHTDVLHLRPVCFAGLPVTTRELYRRPLSKTTPADFALGLVSIHSKGLTSNCPSLVCIRFLCPGELALIRTCCHTAADLEDKTKPALLWPPSPSSSYYLISLYPLCSKIRDRVINICHLQFLCTLMAITIINITNKHNARVTKVHRIASGQISDRTSLDLSSTGPSKPHPSSENIFFI